MRIVFACRDRAMTNKELAQSLGTTPGTIHYHLRPLVAEGFLRAEDPRPGPRGSWEQPYRSTGKSWDLAGDESSGQILRQVGVEEVMSAAAEDLLELGRLGLTLPEGELEELMQQLHAWLDDAKARSLTSESDGAEPLESVTVFVAVHRTPGGPRSDAGAGPS
jgi:predicted ArsR family transcriptional regulator